MEEENHAIGKELPHSGYNRKSDSLTIDEQEKLLSVVETFEDLVLFGLELTTGIRREDITSIEISNIDIESRKISFWENKKRRTHTVPIAKVVLPDLVRYLNSLPKGQKRLFTFTGRTAYNKLQYYLNKAGIKKKLAFHDLRRTFVKTAKRKGMSDKAIAQITGDKIETISEYYSNLSHDELKEESDKL
jgi:integrase